ncbi:MAG: hypothetical protein GY703_25165 [Gammaproteobacteria bacterium]|nr:hypothetical protein [Gammaproteobacteria bacterium]
MKTYRSILAQLSAQLSGPLSALVFFVMLLAPIQAFSESLTGSLARGGVVRIDPDTNRATVYSRQGASQLWDGTHELEDGSVIIINDGIVTSGSPAERNARPYASPDSDLTQISSSACVDLVIKVCGFNGACKNDEACSPARQLMQLEKEEAWQTRIQGPNQTSAQCRKALSNEKYFTRCPSQQLSDAPSACENLVQRVCGHENDCKNQPGCNAARQLFAMETQERLASRRPEDPTYTSGKCLDAMGDSGFFRKCGDPVNEAALEDAGNGSETPGSETTPAQPRFRDSTRR